jgi:hypothetical protein
MVIGAVLMVMAPVMAKGGQSDVAAIRQATAPFHDISKAEAAEYQLLDVCFEDPAGGMGFHYVNPGLIADPEVAVTRPEALVYEPTSNGRLKLVGVEYIAALPETAPPPVVSGLDMEMHWNPAVGLWVLHAYVWKPNPAGMFEDWNPRIGGCP